MFLLFVLGSCDVFFSDLARKLDMDFDIPQTSTYRVSFSPNGGLGTALERTAQPDSPVSDWPPTPLWENNSRSFLGWMTLDGTAFTISSAVSSNMTVYARWSEDALPDQTVAIFDLKGGMGNFPLFQIMDSTNNNIPTRPSPDPEKRGYNFLNWYHEGTGGEVLWNFSNIIDQDTLIYALWELRTYTVRYHENNEGTNRDVSISNIAFNSSDSILDYQHSTLGFTPPTGKVFSSWNTINNPANSPSTRFHPDQDLDILPGWGSLATASTINLYAIWVDDNINDDDFTVSFNLNGGNPASQPSEQLLKLDDLVTKPTSDPSRTGYSFLGWFSDPGGVNEWIFSGTSADRVQGDTVLFAGWERLSYRVAYNANGSSGTPPSGGSFEYNQTVTIASPGGLTLTGHSFSHWNSSDSASDPAATRFFPGQSSVNLSGWDDDTTASGTPPLPTVTLYAQWSINTYTVSFNSMQGSHVDSVSRNHDQLLGDIGSPTRTGYNFVEWQDIDDNPWDENSTVTANITLYAVWTAATPITITFNSNGGYPATRTITTAPGFKITAPASPTWEGWAFTAWYTHATEGEQFDFDNTTVSSNTTLYARWTRAPIGNGDDIPFHVRNEYELRRVGRGALNTGEHAAYVNWTLDKNYVQVNSFVMEGGDFIPIGVGVSPQVFTGSYQGEYEGVKHTITDLQINRSDDYAALFAETSSSAVISNLGLINVSITGSTHTGSLVGLNRGRIENCFATGRVLVTYIPVDLPYDMPTNIGGLVGQNRGNINESYTDMEYVRAPAVINGNNYVGGFVGNNMGLITNSYAAVREVSGSVYIGGLVGYNSGLINSTYATALVISYSDYHFGGIAGYNTGGAIISDSAALNPGLERSSGTYGNARRVVGSNQGSLDNNYARIMRVLNNTMTMPYLIPNTNFSYLIYPPNDFDHDTYWGAHIYQALTLPDLFMNYSALLNLLNEDWWRGNGSNFFNNLRGPGFDISSNPDNDPATDSVWVYISGRLPTLRNTTGRVQNPMPHD